MSRTGYYQTLGWRQGNVDWCEENFVWHSMIAELWNTLSSVPICVVGLLGLRLCLRHGLELRYAVAYATVAVVGFGSVVFHGTLLWAGQALDELPMIWASLVFLFLTLDYDKPTPSMGLATGLAVYCAFITTVYVFFPSAFVLFFTSYFVVVAVLFFRAYGLYKASKNRIQRRLFLLSGVTYVGGFLLLWVPEHLLCVRVPTDSRNTPTIVAVERLQLHAWFHLTSTIGPYFSVLFNLWTRLDALGRKPVYGNAQIMGGLMRLPFVLPRSKRRYLERPE